MDEKTEGYFYLTDIKVLVNISVREMELHRLCVVKSNLEVSHYLILIIVESLATKSSWVKLRDYRCQNIRNLVDYIEKISPSIGNHMLAY
jgi:hypothetical protein